MRSLLVLALALVVTAAPEAPAAFTTRAKLKKPKRGFQVRVGEYTIPPGADREWCEYRRLPNKKEMLVRGFELRMPEGAHHFVLWAYNGSVSDDTKFPKRPVESPGCAGVGPGDTFLPVNLFGMQIPNGRVQFPPGIAVRIEARQQVWLNPHMKNFHEAAMTPGIVFNMIPARKSAVEHLAESFAIGNMAGISIPGGGTQTLVSEWTAPVPLNIIQLSSHQHRFGTWVSAEVENGDGSFTTVFENDDWEHPRELWMHQEAPWEDLDPAVLRLERGRKLRFTCKWHNTDTAAVHFGVKTTDEMCFVTGYYYRDPGTAGAIAGPGCIPASEGLTCPLSRTVSTAD